MLNNRKAKGMIINDVKFTRRHVVMCVAHDKCGILLVNTEKVDMYTKKQHLVLTKSNH